MTGLPTGEITYFFTDVEGSTGLWERYPESMRRALARHDALVSGEVELHRGVVVRSRGEGDSFFAVFPDARDAACAAVALQRALLMEPWPPETRLRVRAALHTGEADLRDGNYYGAIVNRCARLRAAAHGGQTLVSGVTFDRIRDALPEGIQARCLGAHRLKDLLRPEQIYQLDHPDLPTEFPALRSLELLQHNLPVQTTSFVGRERETQEVQRLVRGTPLLTLMGAGGCGKTRLSLQAAGELADTFPDGVWLVELAPVSDPGLVPLVVASALKVREEAGLSLTATLVEHLRHKDMLLVLDNCEHLVGAAATLADELLRTCPRVRILATSREALRIPGETTWEVPLLTVPPGVPALSQAADPLQMLRQYEATRLFLDRASASSSTFQPSAGDAAAIAQICRRLDGIPLAIELAAPWVKALSVTQIAARLDDCFQLLTRGRRTDLPRQQTLRALIDWSYDLLDDEERALLRYLSIFAGGWSLDAAEAVCHLRVDELGPLDVLDLLYRLIEKSLVIASESRDGGTGYRLLETVRQYAREKLRNAGEEAPLAARHCEWFLDLAESASKQLPGPEPALWHARLDDNRENLRAALEGCPADELGAERSLRLIGALWRFWYERGHRSEWLGALERAMGREGVPDPVRIKALSGAGILAWAHGDYVNARRYHGECLEMRRRLGDHRGVANSLNNLGLVASSSGDRRTAREHLAESLAVYRELNDEPAIAGALNNLGGVSIALGEFAEAREFLDESKVLWARLNDPSGTASVLLNLGEVAFREGDLAASQRLLQESLELRLGIGEPRALLHGLHSISTLAIAQGEAELAARLMGAQRAGREALGMAMPGRQRLEGEANERSARELLGDDRFECLRDEGTRMTVSDACRLALASRLTRV